jgi:hypothetical protein
VANSYVKKMLNITSHEGNENQTHNEPPPETFQGGYYQTNKTKQKMSVGKYVAETGTLVCCWWG